MPTNNPGYIRAYYERERQKIIDALGGKCIVCGTTLGLEIHHHDERYSGKQTNGRGRLNRLTDWKRSLPNGTLRLLCVDCHRENHIEEKLSAKEATKV